MQYSIKQILINIGSVISFYGLLAFNQDVTIFNLWLIFTFLECVIVIFYFKKFLNQQLQNESADDSPLIIYFYSHLIYLNLYISHRIALARTILLFLFFFMNHRILLLTQVTSTFFMLQPSMATFLSCPLQCPRSSESAQLVEADT